MKLQLRSTLALVMGLFCVNGYADCRTDIKPSTPGSRFTINGDGTVTDNNSGLMWMRCSLGQTWDGSSCVGSASSHSWEKALSRAESHSFAGHDDWNLPNIKQLSSILEYACFFPVINETIFPNLPASYYWSSSPYANDAYVNASYHAWLIWFYNGAVTINGKSLGAHVLLVREGQ